MRCQVENVYKEVNFEKYCKTCKYKNLDPGEDPCDGCLSEPMNVDSRKPVYWKEAENGR